MLSFLKHGRIKTSKHLANWLRYVSRRDRLPITCPNIEGRQSAGELREIIEAKNNQTGHTDGKATKAHSLILSLPRREEMISWLNGLGASASPVRFAHTGKPGGAPDQETIENYYRILIESWFKAAGLDRHITAYVLHDDHMHALIEPHDLDTGRAITFKTRSDDYVKKWKTEWNKTCRAFGFEVREGKPGRQSPGIADLKQHEQKHGMKSRLADVLQTFQGNGYRDLTEHLRQHGIGATIRTRKENVWLTLTVQTERGLRRFNSARLPLNPEDRIHLETILETELERRRKRKAVRPRPRFTRYDRAHAHRIVEHIQRSPELHHSIRQGNLAETLKHLQADGIRVAGLLRFKAIRFDILRLIFSCHESETWRQFIAVMNAMAPEKTRQFPERHRAFPVRIR